MKKLTLVKEGSLFVIGHGFRIFPLVIRLSSLTSHFFLINFACSSLNTNHFEVRGCLTLRYTLVLDSPLRNGDKIDPGSENGIENHIRRIFGYSFDP